MRKNTQARRRAAALLAALAALIMSSGLALVMTASPASAKTPVNICHATSSDTNPYTFITVDDDSAKYQAHLAHRNTPNKTWKTDGTFNGVPHTAGQAKPDLIGGLDGVVDAARCNGEVAIAEAVADVDFTDPTCANENEASWEGTGEHVTFAVTDGSAAPGQDIEVTATADDNYTFEGGGTTQVFTHTFGDAVDLEGPPCVIVNPPGRVTPGDVSFVDPTCDTDPGVILPEEVEVETPSRVAAGPVITTKDVNGVHYEVTGTLAPGGTVEVDATALPPNELAEGATTHWSHTFPELTGCEVVIVDPPGGSEGTEETPVATPQVVHAGLAEVKPDLRGQQGLALLVGGMILMVVAGGLGLTGRRTHS